MDKKRWRDILAKKEEISTKLEYILLNSASDSANVMTEEDKIAENEPTNLPRKI